MSKLRLVVCAMVALSVPSLVSADWYSGDPYLAATAWPQYTDALSPVTGIQELALTFDNFTWVPGGGGGAVDVVGGHFHSFGQHTGINNDLAYWEIRTGMSHNVGGTLLYSGSGVVTSYATSFTQGGYTVFGVSVDVPDFTLPVGSYWFGLAVGTTSSNSNDVGTFVASTTGTNGIGGPLGDDQSIYFQSLFNGSIITWDYTESAIVNTVVLSGFDPSYYINEVPEPATVGSLAVAVLCCVGRRSRS